MSVIPDTHAPEALKQGLPARSRTPGLALWLVALFLVVLGGRLILVSQYGSALPQLDEWDAVGLGILKPAHEGTLNAEALLAPHNEHRILLTRLLTLGLWKLTGGWPVWSAFAFNALLNALVATVFFSLLGSVLSRGGRLLLWLAVVLTMGGPVGWQNALWGFQSAFYLCGLLSALGILLLASSLPGVAVGSGGEVPALRQGMGLVFLLLAPLSLGSGVLATLSLCLCALVCAWSAGLPSLRGRKALLLCLLAVLSVALLFSPTRAHDQALAPHSLAQALQVLGACLAWPLMELPFVALLLHAPAVLLLVDLLARRRRPSTAEAAALALWVVALLNAGAIVLTRAGGLVQGIPLSRYQDVLIPSLFANLFLLLARPCAGFPARCLRFGWLACAALGLALLWSEALINRLPLQDQLRAARVEMVEGWLSGRDPGALEKALPALRPHPDPAVVKRVVSDPYLRSLLPADFHAGAPWPDWLGLAFVALGGVVLPWAWRGAPAADEP